MEYKEQNVVRGIVHIINGKHITMPAVEVVGDIHKINLVYNQEEIKNDDKVLGVLIEDRFNICYHIELNIGQSTFGYFISNDKIGNYKFQLIEGFNKFSYDHNKPSYNLGEQISLKKDDIKEINFQFKDMFKSEFI